MSDLRSICLPIKYTRRHNTHGQTHKHTRTHYTHGQTHKHIHKRTRTNNTQKHIQTPTDTEHTRTDTRNTRTHKTHGQTYKHGHTTHTDKPLDIKNERFRSPSPIKLQLHFISRWFHKANNIQYKDFWQAIKSVEEMMLKSKEQKIEHNQLLNIFRLSWSPS